VEQILELRQLAITAEERRLQTILPKCIPTAPEDANGSPELHRPRQPLQLMFARRLVGQAGASGLHGDVVHQDGARRSGGLNAGGDVHTVTGHETLIRAVEQRYATGHDAAARRQLPQATLFAKSGDGLHDVQSRAHATFGVVLPGRP
jgi:hypothetical protein